jgi:hypothetical protein
LLLPLPTRVVCVLGVLKLNTRVGGAVEMVGKGVWEDDFDGNGG